MQTTRPTIRSASFRPLSGSPQNDLTFAGMLFFLLLHAPLMVIFRAVPALATGHSILVVLIGLYYLFRDKDPMRVVFVLAYISSAELMWRGVEASPVWEYGKYATLLLVILMMLKYRLFTRGLVWPLLFVALLVPGILIMPAFDRQAVSYELAGPVTLAVLTLALNHIEFKRTDLQRLFAAILAPAVAMAALVVVMLASNDIQFYTQGENELITAYIGANQVSSTLSWGALAAFFYVFVFGWDKRLRNLMLFGFISLLAISILTFSRAGLWNAIGAMIVSLFFLVRDRRRFIFVQGLLLVAGLATYFIVYPLLVDLTDGAVLARFSDFNSTGRDRLAISDYQTFTENPVFGVGVGQARYHREYLMDRFKNNHTEYTRLLAEHGIFGLAVILLLLGVPMTQVFSSRPPLSKGISIGLVFWALFYLLHSATRTVAPSFAFGLASARFLPEEETLEETGAPVNKSPVARARFR